MRRKSMSGPVKCLVYIIALGVVSFVTGRLLPKRWFKSDRFPFRCNEKEKKLYKALRVKDWQNKVPDMSRVFTKLMPAKKLNADTLAVVVNINADFIHPVFYGDHIEILTAVVRIGTKSITVSQQAINCKTGSVVSTCRTVLVAFSASRNDSIAVPDEIRRRFTQYENNILI